MKLYLSPTSPLARLCLMFALQHGLRDMELHFLNPWDNPPN